MSSNKDGLIWGKRRLVKIYDTLYKKYGPQGWWPLTSVDGCNPTKTGSVNGYHPGDYSYPRTRLETFEICVGAILTQNTAWPSVEKSLLNLKCEVERDGGREGGISPERILKMDSEVLKMAIKPAGYFNQKARKLREFSRFFIDLKGRVPSRDELLAIWGVGPETADSMLLYAFKVPTFVVDTYTRRIFVGLKMVGVKDSYDDIKAVFEKAIKPDLQVYQEYHALIVEHAKRHYSSKGDKGTCPLAKEFGNRTGPGKKKIA